MKIKSISRRSASCKVYNIRCGPDHTYFANNVLVHNCDVPNIKFGGNATFEDLKNQLYSARRLFPGTKYTERLNIHFARMGDPIFNSAVFEFSRWLAENKKTVQDELDLRIEVIHPVLTTSLPRKFTKLTSRIQEWCEIKNDLFNGQAGLQFSINSTSEEQRSEMFRGDQTTLDEFAVIASTLPEPVGRKYCLNFAYSTDFEIDAKKVSRMFDKDKFMIKITPIHNNNACRENEIETSEGYASWKPYSKPEEDLKSEGWDVLVFVPSMDEEDGLVTCGNAVLGGGEVTAPEMINITGES